MKDKITCIVIDDEPVAIDILKEYIGKTQFLNLQETFREPLKALEFLQRVNVDLIFLDINMPNLSGLEFLAALNQPPLVIFTTAYSEFAVESYDFDAVDYLLKPIEFSRFLKAANKALEIYRLKKLSSDNMLPSNDDEFILIKSGSDFHKLKFDEILYIQGAGNYVFFYTANNKIIHLCPMNEVLEKLPGKYFIRIHKSYIINFSKIDIIEKDKVKIHDKSIPIGEIYKENLERFIDESRK